MGDFAPKRNSYNRTQPVWARDLLKSENHGVLINGDAMLAAHPDGVVPSGTAIMTTNAAPKLGVPEGTAASTFAGYLINELKVEAGGRYLEAVLHAGTVTERLLPGGAAPAGLKAALPAIVHI